MKTYELKRASNTLRILSLFGLLCFTVLFVSGIVAGSLYNILSSLVGIAIFIYFLFSKIIWRVMDDEINVDTVLFIFRWKKIIRINEIKRIIISVDGITIETEKSYAVSKGSFSEKDLDDFINQLNEIKEKYNV